MANIKTFDMRFLEDLFSRHRGRGFVLNFSDRTFAEFFKSEVRIDIDDPRFAVSGPSKGRRLSTFLQTEGGPLAARALRALWDYRDAIDGPFDEQDPKIRQQKTRYFQIIQAAEAGGQYARTDAIDTFVANETLEELVAAIERDIRADKPAAALDRLHTYCMKRFAHVLSQRGISVTRDDPLHSRAGKYVRAIEQAGQVRDISLRVMKSSISIFDSFNTVRNEASFAHDNEIVDRIEARFIFDSITSILRFMKGFEANRFGE
jgi:hypothetical protein